MTKEPNLPVLEQFWEELKESEIFDEEEQWWYYHSMVIEIEAEIELLPHSPDLNPQISSPGTFKGQNLSG